MFTEPGTLIRFQILCQPRREISSKEKKKDSTDSESEIAKITPRAHGNHRHYASCDKDDTTA